MHGEFLRLIFLQAHRETTAHSTAIGIAYSFSSVEQVFDTRCVVTLGLFRSFSIQFK